MPKKRIPMNSFDMKDIIYPNEPKNVYASLYP